MPLSPLITHGGPVVGPGQKESGWAASSSSWDGSAWTLGPSTRKRSREQVNWDGYTGEMSMPTLKWGGATGWRRVLLTSAATAAISRLSSLLVIASWVAL